MQEPAVARGLLWLCSCLVLCVVFSCDRLITQAEQLAVVHAAGGRMVLFVWRFLSIVVMPSLLGYVWCYLISIAAVH